MHDLPAATRLQQDLIQCDVPEEDVSLCFLEDNGSKEQEPSLARVESYQPAAVKKIVATGHFEWGLKGPLTANTSGGVTRVLSAMGIPREEARAYEILVQKGWILLSAFCHDLITAKRVKMALQRVGARDIASIGRSTETAPEAASP